MKSFIIIVFVVVFCSPSTAATNCSGVFYERRPSLRECEVISGTPKNNVYYYQDHLTAGATPECLPLVDNINSVSCYKWVLGDLCDPSPTTRLFLRNRASIIDNQKMVTATAGSVSFLSPNFFAKRKRQHYMYNSMFCMYNISVDDCENGTVTVRSTSEDHSLYEDGKDYLHFDFGQVTSTVRGGAAGTFSETVHVSSFTVFLWTDAKPDTDFGRFEFEAVCNEKVDLEDIYDIY